VGKKTAEKIVFHLKDKLAGEAGTGAPGWSESDTEVIAALTALGYTIVEAQTALQRIPADAPATRKPGCDWRCKRWENRGFSRLYALLESAATSEPLSTIREV